MKTAGDVGDVDWPRGANRGVGESSSGPHFQIAVAFAQADVDESCVFDGVVIVLRLSRHGTKRAERYHPEAAQSVIRENSFLDVFLQRPSGSYPRCCCQSTPHSSSCPNGTLALC